MVKSQFSILFHPFRHQFSHIFFKWKELDLPFPQLMLKFPYLDLISPPTSQNRRTSRRQSGDWRAVPRLRETLGPSPGPNFDGQNLGEGVPGCSYHPTYIS